MIIIYYALLLITLVGIFILTVLLPECLFILQEVFHVNQR
jgi:hypothetical protein